MEDTLQPYTPEQWAISFGMRNNLMFNDIPHVPLFVEDIFIYVSLDDYEDNSIKTIQTIGELIPKSESFAMLLSLTPGNDAQFPISLRNLNIQDIYVKDSNNMHCAIWEKHNAFRVYGTIEHTDIGTVLVVSHLVPLQDIKGSWNVMTILKTMARYELRQYYRTPSDDKAFKLQWQKMKEQNKRLVNEPAVKKL